MRRAVLALLALALIGLALWRLEGARAGVEITGHRFGETPVRLYQGSGVGPLVVLAHGFAGSQRMMEPLALTLAHAGYRALTYDFEGHGRNPVPMSGDVATVGGTTARLVAQTRAVLAGGRALTGWQEPVALIGHSMASDIVVRAGLAEGAAAIVAISMYSEAVTESGPANLLILSGEWEPGLRRVALDALRQVAPEAEEGETAAGPPRRRAVVAPNVEHLGVLYSPVTLAETRAWLDAAFARTPGQGRLATTGGWIAALLLGIVLLGRALVASTPPAPAPAELPARRFWTVALLPAVAVPLALRPLPTAFLPVLVADYLALHLLAYGALLLALSRRVPLRGAVWAGLALALWGIAVFGLALDRYFSSFLPVAERLPVLAALLPGALAYALGEARALRGGQAPLWQALTLRGAFLGSLALAAALDFDRLMFLLIILPVMLAWFAIFATQAGWVGRRHGPLAAGLGAGAILAWTLGVTFPLFVR